MHLLEPDPLEEESLNVFVTPAKPTPSAARYLAHDGAAVASSSSSHSSQTPSILEKAEEQLRHFSALMRASDPAVVARMEEQRRQQHQLQQLERNSHSSPNLRLWSKAPGKLRQLAEDLREIQAHIAQAVEAAASEISDLSVSLGAKITQSSAAAAAGRSVFRDGTSCTAAAAAAAATTRGAEQSSSPRPVTEADCYYEIILAQQKVDERLCDMMRDIFVTSQKHFRQAWDNVEFGSSMPLPTMEQLQLQSAVNSSFYDNNPNIVKTHPLLPVELVNVIPKPTASSLADGSIDISTDNITSTGDGVSPAAKLSSSSSSAVHNNNDNRTPPPPSHAALNAGCPPHLRAFLLPPIVGPANLDTVERMRRQSGSLPVFFTSPSVAGDNAGSLLAAVGGNMRHNPQQLLQVPRTASVGPNAPDALSPASRAVLRRMRNERMLRREVCETATKLAIYRPGAIHHTNQLVTNVVALGEDILRAGNTGVSSNRLNFTNNHRAIAISPELFADEPGLFDGDMFRECLAQMLKTGAWICLGAPAGADEISPSPHSIVTSLFATEFVGSQKDSFSWVYNYLARRHIRISRPLRYHHYDADPVLQPAWPPYKLASDLRVSSVWSNNSKGSNTNANSDALFATQLQAARLFQTDQQKSFAHMKVEDLSKLTRPRGTDWFLETAMMVQQAEERRDMSVMNLIVQAQLERERKLVTMARQQQQQQRRQQQTQQQAWTGAKQPVPFYSDSQSNNNANQQQQSSNAHAAISQQQHHQQDQLSYARNTQFAPQQQQQQQVPFSQLHPQQQRIDYAAGTQMPTVNNTQHQQQQQQQQQRPNIASMYREYKQLQQSQRSGQQDQQQQQQQPFSSLAAGPGGIRRPRPQQQLQQPQQGGNSSYPPVDQTPLRSTAEQQQYMQPMQPATPLHFSYNTTNTGDVDDSYVNQQQIIQLQRQANQQFRGTSMSLVPERESAGAGGRLLPYLGGEDEDAGSFDDAMENFDRVEEALARQEKDTLGEDNMRVLQQQHQQQKGDASNNNNDSNGDSDGNNKMQKQPDQYRLPPLRLASSSKMRWIGHNNSNLDDDEYDSNNNDDDDDEPSPTNPQTAATLLTGGASGGNKPLTMMNFHNAYNADLAQNSVQYNHRRRSSIGKTVRATGRKSRRSTGGGSAGATGGIAGSRGVSVDGGSRPSSRSRAASKNNNDDDNDDDGNNNNERQPRSSNTAADGASGVPSSSAKASAGGGGGSRRSQARKRSLFAADPSQMVFQFTPSVSKSKDTKEVLDRAIKNIGAHFSKTTKYDPLATHLVAEQGPRERTEKYLGFLATGKPIVTPAYLLDCEEAKFILDEAAYRPYDDDGSAHIGPSYTVDPATSVVTRLQVNNLPPGSTAYPFRDWRVILFANASVSTGIKTILCAGGCQELLLVPFTTKREAEDIQSLPFLKEVEEKHKKTPFTHILVEMAPATANRAVTNVYVPKQFREMRQDMSDPRSPLLFTYSLEAIFIILTRAKEHQKDELLSTATLVHYCES